MADITASVGLELTEANRAIQELAKRLDTLLSSLTDPVKIAVDANTKKAEDTLRGAKSKFEKAIGQSGGLDVKVDADTAPAVKKLRGASGQFKKAGNDLGESAGKGFGTSFTDVLGGSFIGSALGNIAANFAGQVFGGVSEAIGAAQEFEQGVAGLSAITGVTGDGLDDLANRARNLAQQFGGSAQAQLDSFQGILSKFGPALAGQPEALGAISENINLLGKAAGLDAATAMGAITDSMLQFGVNVKDGQVAAEESARFMNVLAAGAQAGAAEVPDVTQAVLQAGVAAKGANLSFEEVNSAIQVLAVGGKKGSEAGVGLRNVLGLLQKQSGPGAQKLKEMGLSVEQLGETLTTQGLEAALRELGAGIDGLGTDAQKNAALMQLFGTENAATAGILLQNVDTMNEFTDAVTGTTSGLDQAATNMNTFGERLSRLKAVVADAFIDAFQNVAPILNNLFDDIVPQLFDAIKNIGSALAPTFKIIGGIIGGAVLGAVKAFLAVLTSIAKGLQVLKPVIPVIAAGLAAYAVATNASAIASGIAAAKQAVLNAVMAANPFGAVLLAITALVAGVAILIDALDESAEEQLEAAEATKENIQTQIDQNKANQQGAKETKKLAAEFEQLAEKENRTAEETKRLEEIQRELDSQYPDLIDQTADFRDNLEGVSEVGKLATTELGNLSAEATELEATMRKTTAQIAGLQRNVAIEELQDSFGRVNFFGGSSENKFRRDLQKRVDTFQAEIFKAADSQQVKQATARLLDFLNLEGSNLDDSTQLQEIIQNVLNVQSKSLAALQTWRGEVEKTGEAVENLGGDPPPVVPPTDEDVGNAKEHGSVLEAAQKKYAALKKESDSLLKTEILRVKAREDLTEAEKKALTEGLTQEANDKLREQARNIFSAVLDEQGLFVSSSIRLAADESVSAVRDIFNALGVKAGEDFARIFTEGIRRRALQPFTGRLAVPIEIKEPEPSNLEKLAKDLLKPATTLAKSIGSAFKDLFAPVAEENTANIEGQTEKLREQLKSGEIAYVQYAAKVGELNQEMADDPNRLDRLFDGINSAIGASMDNIIDTMQTKLDQLAEKVADGSAHIGQAFGLIAIIGGASFGQLLADGENAIKAFVLGALDALNALVPILVAQITGVQLASPNPANAASFGAAGLAAAAGLTAAFTAAVQLAKSAVKGAFKFGGMASGLVLTGEEGPEMVVRHRPSVKYQSFFEDLNSGMDFTDALLRKDMRRKLNLDKLGIALSDNLAIGDTAVAVLAEKKDDGGLVRELQALRQSNERMEAELKALRADRPTTNNIKIDNRIDKRAITDEMQKAQIEYAEKW